MIPISSQQSRWTADLFARRRWKWSFAWFPDRDRTLHPQYILEAEFCYAGSKLPIDAITGISDNHSRRDLLLYSIADLIQRNLRLGLESNILGDPARLPPFLVANPNLRQVQ